MNEPTITQLEILVDLANTNNVSEVAAKRGVSRQAVYHRFNEVKAKLMPLALAEDIQLNQSHLDCTEFENIADVAGLLGFLRFTTCRAYEVAPEWAFLSQRKRGILILLANGETLDRIARLLGLTVNTIKTHVVEMRSTLGAVNTPHAVAIGIKRGIISTSDIRS